MCGIQDVKNAKTDPVAWRVLAECTCTQATTVRNMIVAPLIVCITLANLNAFYGHASGMTQLITLATWVGPAVLVSLWKARISAFAIAGGLGASDIICYATDTLMLNAVIWLVLWTTLLRLKPQRLEALPTHTHEDGQVHAGGDTHLHLHVHQSPERQLGNVIDGRILPQRRPMGELSEPRIDVLDAFKRRVPHDREVS